MYTAYQEWDVEWQQDGFQLERLRLRQLRGNHEGELAEKARLGANHLHWVANDVTADNIGVGIHFAHEFVDCFGARLTDVGRADEEVVADVCSSDSGCIHNREPATAWQNEVLERFCASGTGMLKFWKFS